MQQSSTSNPPSVAGSSTSRTSKDVSLASSSSVSGSRSESRSGYGYGFESGSELAIPSSRTSISSISLASSSMVECVQPVVSTATSPYIPTSTGLRPLSLPTEVGKVRIPSDVISHQPVSILPHAESTLDEKIGHLSIGSVIGGGSISPKKVHDAAGRGISTKSESLLTDLPHKSKRAGAGNLGSSRSTLGDVEVSDVHRLSPGRQRRRSNSPEQFIGSESTTIKEKTNGQDKEQATIDSQLSRRPTTDSRDSQPPSTSSQSVNPPPLQTTSSSPSHLVIDEKRKRSVAFDSLPPYPPKPLVERSENMASASYSPSRNVSSGDSIFSSLSSTSNRRRQSPAATLVETQVSPSLMGTMEILLEQLILSTPGVETNRSPLVHRSDVTNDDLLSSMFGPMSANSSSSPSVNSTSGFFPPRPGSGNLLPTSPTQPIRQRPSITTPPDRVSFASQGFDNTWMSSDTFSSNQVYHHSAQTRSAGHDFGMPLEQRSKFGQAIAKRDMERQCTFLTMSPPPRRLPKTPVRDEKTVRPVDSATEKAIESESSSTPPTTAIVGLGIKAPGLIEETPSGDILVASSSQPIVTPRSHSSQSSSSPALVDGVRPADLQTSRARTKVGPGDVAKEQIVSDVITPQGPQGVPKAIVVGGADPVQHPPVVGIPLEPLSVSSRSSRSSARFRSYNGPNLPEFDSGYSGLEIFSLAFGDGTTSGRDVFNSGKSKKKPGPVEEVLPEGVTGADDSFQPQACLTTEVSAADTVGAPPLLPTPAPPTSDSDVKARSVSDSSFEELPVVIKEELASEAAAPIEDKLNNLALPEIEVKTISRAGSTSNGTRESRSSDSLSVSKRSLQPEDMIQPAVILPVMELQLIAPRSPPPLASPTSAVSSSGPDGSHPRVQNSGDLRPHGTFTTGRRPATQRQSTKSSAALLFDDRFVSISEDQLEAAALGGDQIAETHLRDRQHNNTREGPSRGSSPLEAIEPCPPRRALEYAPSHPDRRLKLEESFGPPRSRNSSSTSIQSFSSSDLSRRKSSVQSFSSSDLSRRKSSGSSLLSYLSTREELAVDVSSPGLGTIQEGVTIGPDAVRSAYTAPLPGQVEPRISSESPRASATSPQSIIPSQRELTRSGRGIDPLESELTAAMERVSLNGAMELQDNYDPFAHLRQGQSRLRISEDPFTTDLSLLPITLDEPERRGSTESKADGSRSPTYGRQMTPGYNTLQSELFSDVARLTSLDLRKDLAREAKEIRLNREALDDIKTKTSRPRRSKGTPVLGPDGTPVSGGETREERRARHQRHRRHKAHRQLEDGWRKELEERDAVAPSITGLSPLDGQSKIAERATPSRSEVTAALHAEEQAKE